MERREDVLLWRGVMRGDKGPCVLDLMGVCEGWKRDDDEWRELGDESVNKCFVLLPLCSLLVLEVSF